MTNIFPELTVCDGPLNGRLQNKEANNLDKKFSYSIRLQIYEDRLGRFESLPAFLAVR